MKRQITRGKLWYKYTWFSICSVHYFYDGNCKMCNTGSWVNDWKNYIDSIIYKISPKLWQKVTFSRINNTKFENVATYLKKKDRLDKLKKLSK